jgi:hypothetical protein
MRRSLLPLVLLLAPSALAAQLPNNSTRALGLGGAYTVYARGFEAVAWNPAALGVRGRPGFTIGLPQGSLEFGSSDLGFSDFRKYADKFLSAQDKADILAKIDTALGIRTIGGVTPFALSIGRFGFSLGVAGDVDARLGKDAVDLALNGNASRSGPGQFFTAAGSRGSGWAATTAAASIGWPLVSSPLGRITVGATAKYIWGNGLGRGNETSSQFQINPAFQVHAAGHAIYTDYESNNDLSFGNAPGHGFGVDLGGMLEMPGGLTIGASLVNIVNTMSWKADRLTYERDDYLVTQAANGQLSDTQVKTKLTGAAIDGDPVARAFRDSLLDNAHFSRLARVGVGLKLGKLLVAADGQLRLSDGLDHPPSQFVSAGAEYVLLGILPLRAGIGSDFAHQLTLSAGTGLYLGPVHLEISAANISGSNNPGVRIGGGLALIF